MARTKYIFKKTFTNKFKITYVESPNTTNQDVLNKQLEDEPKIFNLIKSKYDSLTTPDDVETFLLTDHPQYAKRKFSKEELDSWNMTDD